MNVIELPISYGEGFDKLSILDIKLHRVTDTNRLKQVQHEYTLLKERLRELSKRDGLDLLYQQLYYVNELIWDVENKKRSLELSGHVFTDIFCNTAREVYLLNDKRAEVKRSIDTLLSSSIQEVKSHPPYKKGKLFLITHTGLGDMMMCNGLVRYKCLQHKEVRILVNKPYLDTIKFMYRDLNNISYELYDDNDPTMAMNTISQTYNNGQIPPRLAKLLADGYEFMPLGDHRIGEHWSKCAYDFCEAFYKQAGVPLSAKHRFGYVMRDKPREEELYNKVISVLGPDYRVVHDDPTRNFNINRQLLQVALPEFHTSMRTLGDKDVWSSNIFDYCTLIDRANEYHGFDSSFFAMMDLVKSTCKSINLHTYIRPLHCKIYSSLSVNMVGQNGTQSPTMSCAILNTNASISDINAFSKQHPEFTHVTIVEKGYRINADLHRFLTIDEPFLYSNYAVVGHTEFNEFIIYDCKRLQNFTDIIPTNYTWIMHKNPVVQDK
jgi:hypothetical protein